jgi:hypothetical protein
MSISVAENMFMSVQSMDLVRDIKAEFHSCDGSCTDFETTGSPIAIAQGVTNQSLGSTTPATCIGRLVHVTKLFIQTNLPCVLSISFNGGAAQTIPLTDVLFINGNISSLAISTPTGPINLRYLAAGLLV